MNSKTAHKAIVLVSGGLDSTVMLAEAIANGRTCHAICFDYGQRHRLEIRSAQAICRHYNVPLKIIKIDSSAFGNSALVSQQAVPQNRSPSQIAALWNPFYLCPCTQYHVFSFCYWIRRNSWC